MNKLAIQQDGIPYEQLSEERKAFLKIVLQKDFRKNTYDPETGILTVSELREEAIASNSKFYGGLFTNDPALADLRDAYSIPENSLKDPERVPLLNSFFLLDFLGLCDRTSR